jgi:hypothetical protein
MVADVIAGDDYRTRPQGTAARSFDAVAYAGPIVVAIGGP